MPFWKKSEDPWDYEPEKPSRPAEPGQEEDCAPSLMDELRDWNEERKEKKALRETPPPPMICPWCGQEMEVGTITGGRDSVQWWPGWPNRFFGASGPEIDILHEGSLFNRYKTAWLCRSCRRMVMEIPEEEIPKPLTSEKAAEQLEEQRRREAQRKIDRGLQG